MKSTEDRFTGGFIKLINGKNFYFDKLNVEDLNIEDYAYAMAKINRFTGHTLFPYSIAQHSILMSENCREDLALPCLLHDMHEVIVGDHSKPVKDYVQGNLKLLEKRVEKAVHDHFNIQIPSEVYKIDLQICRAEAEQLIGDTSDWQIDLPSLNVKIEEWHWLYAGRRFLERYYELTGDN